MVAASIWSLIVPAVEQSSAMGQLAFFPAFLGFWAGILFLLLLDHIIPHLHRSINQAEGPKSNLILYGLSYGCRTLMQVLEDNRLSITTTIADGMSLRDYPDIKSDALKELYLFFFTGLFFVVMGRAGKLRKRFLAKITGRSIEEADRILYTKATWKSWRNQDRCLIGKKTDYRVFQNTDMNIWYGIKGTVDKKLSAGLEDLKKQGYPFTVKTFTDMGHGGLIGENTKRFIEEVAAVHRESQQ